MTPDDKAVPLQPRGPAPDGAERRSRLRQYQVQLMERMQAARSGSAAAGKELGLVIGQERCLLDLTQVGEIVPAPAISPVPLAQDWYLGLANIRGNLTGIVDLARYRGTPAGQPGSDSRVVTFGAGLGFNCALLATRVLGLRDLAAMRAEEDDPMAADWARQRFSDAESQRWTRIDLALLVREARFLHVAL
ncbi:MAG TPA: chemotaxis protein CheW [Janthinobacterium sp.]|jgi:twitching motility protein PilI|nr:chemotaxis protein CheW [Janthinobacterium sp.]